MILRLILIAILIFLFIRISQRLLAGIRAVTGGHEPRNNYQAHRHSSSQRDRAFDHIQDAEFEDISDREKEKD